VTPEGLAALPDEALLEAVQRQTFGYFWEGAHPGTAMALDRRTARGAGGDDIVAIGGTGFGIMAILAAVERGWVSREAALARLASMLANLVRMPRFHGAFAHFIHAGSDSPKPLMEKDDGGDLVETSFLCMGLLCAREYFRGEDEPERALRAAITAVWEGVEWSWYTQGGRDVLYWHWSANFGWALNNEIRGWNECLITYVLAASSPTHAIDPGVYHRGFAGGARFVNGAVYAGTELPLGPPWGGPLYFCHYAFCGLDPRILSDVYADYWEQCLRHVQINRAHCIANPLGHAGYGADCWGLTASDDPTGYQAHEPCNDNGTISPTAALSSIPYLPAAALAAARHLLRTHGERVWGRFGFVDAFCEDAGWFADTYLAIDQGPIVVMMENYRSGLLWKLFMGVPEVRRGLQRLNFRVAGRP